MKNIVLYKIISIAKKRPLRFLKKESFIRLKRVLLSSLVYRLQPPGSKPRLYFDLTILSLYDNHTGVQRVVRSVFKEIKELLKEKYEITPVSCTAFTKGFQVIEEHPLDGLRHCKLTGYNISPREGDVFLSMDQAFLEHLAQQDELKKMCDSGCRLIFTVYDLLPLQLPDCFPSEVELIFKKWIDTLSPFSEFICDSKTVAHDLEDYLRLNKLYNNGVYWFYPGGNFISDISSKGITEKQNDFLKNLSKFKLNFFIVGTIEPRKGHKQILRLFNKLWDEDRQNISLTFVGKKGWLTEDLCQKILTDPRFNENLFWFQQASDEFIDKCYKAADAVIVASLNEGYGLPILEASKNKCRIIANNIPVFREVAPKECYFIELTNPSIAYQQLRDWLISPSQKCGSVSPQTWHQTALQILTRTKII